MQQKYVGPVQSRWISFWTVLIGLLLCVRMITYCYYRVARFIYICLLRCLFYAVHTRKSRHS